MKHITLTVLVGSLALAATPAEAAVTIDFEATPDGVPVTEGTAIGDTYAALGVSFSGAIFTQCNGGCPDPANGIFAATGNFTDPITLTFANPINLFSFENVNESSGRATAFGADGAELGMVDFFGFPGEFFLTYNGISSVRFTTLFQYGIDNVSFDAVTGGGTPGGGAGAVPEPATWAMMLLGFFGTGFAMRARPRRRTTVSYS